MLNGDPGLSASFRIVCRHGEPHGRACEDHPWNQPSGGQHVSGCCTLTVNNYCVGHCRMFMLAALPCPVGLGLQCAYRYLASAPTEPCGVHRTSKDLPDTVLEGEVLCANSGVPAGGGSQPALRGGHVRRPAEALRLPVPHPEDAPDPARQGDHHRIYKERRLQIRTLIRYEGTSRGSTWAGGRGRGPGGSPGVSHAAGAALTLRRRAT